jgi:hypothetical protein
MARAVSAALPRPSEPVMPRAVGWNPLYIPMVGDISSNRSSVKRSSKLDFPTPLSPISSSCAERTPRPAHHSSEAHRAAVCSAPSNDLTLNW